jgi:ABC-2 type transport system ATP-binding protein/lipopolysaccharide transport system ATP-binding protein
MNFLRARGVSVEFPVVDMGRRRLFSGAAVEEWVGGRWKSEGTKQSMLALEGIDLELKQGDRLGLIGRNGSGKTTLLRTLAGVYVPTQGYVEASSPVVPFLDNMLGMDPDATGRQNIEIGCLFAGFDRVRTRELATEVEEFSELGSFLDMPMRTYSAGMQARLWFGIQTARRPKIMVLDEGIGAGDAAFQVKVHARLTEFMNEISIIVIASHSSDLLREYCNKGMVLEKGQMKFIGPLDEALEAYGG